jgi:hypothetical protein
VYWGASKNKELGMMSHCQQKACLHFEFPRLPRQDENRADLVSAMSVVLAAAADSSL